MTIIMNLSFIRFLLTSLSLSVCSDYNIYCTIKHHYKYLQWLETQFMVAEHLPEFNPQYHKKKTQNLHLGSPFDLPLPTMVPTNR